MKVAPIALAICVFSALAAEAVSLKDYKPFKYEVLFTNPECDTYFYEEEVLSESGDVLESKPKNVYCKKQDLGKSASRKKSPQYRLIEWIRDIDTKEIFLAYLSFSNKTVREELCSAIEDRNLKVTFVLDQKTSTTQADKLLECRPKNVPSHKAHMPEIHYTGRKGVRGRGTIGYAHNKLFMVNPFDDEKVKLAYSSGNMSSGTVLHHENWHFITTSPESFFVQAHHCLIEGVLKHDSDKRTYKEFISKCKGEIEVQEEEDIKTFFVPGEGIAARNTILNALKRSDSVAMAAHRFSYRKLLEALSAKLTNSDDFDLKLVLDDDVYWSGTLRTAVGSNTTQEAYKVFALAKLGMKVKYMETNQNHRLLHHNKFIIFDFDGGEGAVFSGAGNLTTAAFTNNFENFYYVTIPEVYEQFKKQYKKMWSSLATSPDDMPTKLVMP